MINKISKKTIKDFLSFRKTWLPALVIGIAVFVFNYRTPLELYPENETLFSFSTYSDGIDSLNEGSFTKLDTSKGHFHFSYSLSSTSDAPYATILFHAHELIRTLDIKKYRFIELNIDSERTYDFNLILSMYVPGFSDPGSMDTHRPYVMICFVEKGEDVYKYKLKDLATPGWWFSSFETNPEEIPKTDWRKMTHLSITDCGTAPLDTTLHFSMDRMAFTGSGLPSFLYSLMAFVLYLMFRLIWLEIFRRSKNSKIKKKLYFPDSKKSYSEEENAKLIDYINKNYSDPLLSLKKIEQDLKLNSFQINEIVSDRFNLNYKKYLNNVRVEKSAHLLETTNIPINTIAEKVGYCYSNSYSRVFRQIKNMTPNEYRNNLEAKNRQ